MTLPFLNNQTIESRKFYPERVVQFGAGNFLRGFADWIIQTLNDQTSFASSVVVAKVTSGGTYEALDAQDGLFHVQLKGIQTGEVVSECQRIDCVSRTVYPYQDFEAYLELAKQPGIRFLISNTTEMGIHYDASDQLTDIPPKSFPAKLAIFLHERFQHFKGDPDQGCVVLPTELIDQNGTQLQQYVLQYADQWRVEKAFAEWIRHHNLFCNTLVDRIVTGYPANDADAIFAAIGYQDRLLVSGELYHSWIIEAPESIHAELQVANTNLNVKIVDDAGPYRETKVRILNGTHTAMVMLGNLLGIETVREGIQHEILGTTLRDMVYQEIIPPMDLPEAELRVFAEDVFERFRNPFMRHQLQAIALNSGSKVKARLLPSIISYYEQYEALPPRLTLAVAAFMRLYKGEWVGHPIQVKDDPTIIDLIKQAWKQANSAQEAARDILGYSTLWDCNLNEQLPTLADRVGDYLDAIETGEIAVLFEQL